jgi:hypothetical protein
MSRKHILTARPEKPKIMNNQSIRSASILGILLCIGLRGLGFQVGKSFVDIKTLERTVTVKRLSG